MNRLWVSFLLVVVLAAWAPAVFGADLVQGRGRVTMLRVHDVGSGYGPQSDFIDVEVVIQLDSAPGMAFGFTLRNDANAIAHEGMLRLLQAAFEKNWTVTIDYWITPPKKNGVILRAIVTK